MNRKHATSNGHERVAARQRCEEPGCDFLFLPKGRGAHMRYHKNHPHQTTDTGPSNFEIPPPPEPKKIVLEDLFWKRLPQAMKTEIIADYLQRTA